MGAEIELLEHVAALRVDENNVIGKIVRDEQLVGSVGAGDHRKACWIRKDGSLVGFLNALRHPLPRGNLLRRNSYEAIPTDFALMKALDRNAISRIACLLAGRVSNGTDRSIKMIAIGTERQPYEIALRSLFGQAIFREVRDLVRI